MRLNGGEGAKCSFTSQSISYLLNLYSWSSIGNMFPNMIIALRILLKSSRAMRFDQDQRLDK